MSLRSYLRSLRYWDMTCMFISWYCRMSQSTDSGIYGDYNLLDVCWLRSAARKINRMRYSDYPQNNDWALFLFVYCLVGVLRCHYHLTIFGRRPQLCYLDMKLGSKLCAKLILQCQYLSVKLKRMYENDYILAGINDACKALVLSTFKESIAVRAVRRASRWVGTIIS
jgi:hypothetical protein